MIKVGIRANNLPGKEESVILYHHIVTYYGNHTIEEFKMAFDMAIAGRLDLEDKEVNPYESFDCRYVSKVLNAYRSWAKQVVCQNKDNDIDYSLPATVSAVDWREQVQKALDDFLTGKANPRLWPAQLYDQVASDAFVNGLAYQAFVDKARSKFIAEVNRGMMAIKPNSDADIDTLPSSKYVDYQAKEKLLIQYKNGERDNEVILLAKQMALRHYFKYLKEVEVYKIYQPSETQ